VIDYLFPEEEKTNMPDSNLHEILNSSVVDAVAGERVNPEDLSLDALVLLINTERLAYLKKQTHKELTEVKERQKIVTALNKLLKGINTATNDKGELDISGLNDLQEQLKNAQEYGIEVEEGKLKFTRDERSRLVDNIQMTVEDLHFETDMQMQTVTRLTNERYETYQMARSILRPLHEAKVSHAKAIRGG